MKLLLMSNGIRSSFRNEFKHLLAKNPQDMKVSFVTTAAYGEEENPTWLEVYRKQLRDFGIERIEDLDVKRKTPEELEKLLEGVDMIFVNGGNTFYLLDHVKKSGFDVIARRLIQNGVLYVGISAGSILACPTIESASWEPADSNEVGIKDLSALNLVNFLISPHFDEVYRKIVENESKRTKYPVIAITDEQAVLVTDTHYQIVGFGERLIFSK